MPTPSTKRAALVTGAASGIGRAAALALARAGYDVAINYSKSEREAKAVAGEAGRSGVRTLLCRCDVADEAGVRAMLKTVGDQFGRLDVLINNAGTTAAWKPKDLESLSLEDWDRVFAVNVRGLFQVTRAAVPLLRASNLGPDIRVNAVAPGWMEGDWMQRMLKDKYEDLMGKRAKATPLKRCVTAEDVAETMMSLVQSNRFVTGEVIVVDGGFSSST